MTLELIPPGGEAAFKPPIQEQLKGSETRLAPMPMMPLPMRRQDGDVYWDFEDETPPEEDFRAFRDGVGNPEMHFYCEPFNPGLELQPWARVASMASTVEGLWGTRCKAEEDAVRARLDQFGGADKYRLSVNDIAAMADPERVIKCQTCRFQTVNPEMWNAHRKWWGHQ